MHFFDSIQAEITGQFEVTHLLLAALVITTLILAERYYSGRR